VGEVVRAGAVREVPWPARLVPEDAVRQVGQVVGQALASPVGRGESLTRSRFSTTSLLAGRPSDEVAVHVPVPDAGAAAMLSAGDRVDLLAPDHVIARGVLVLRVDRSLHTDFGAPLAGQGSSAGYAMEGSGIVVAAGQGVAADLARVADDATGRPTVQVVLRQSMTPVPHGVG
jgi:Flp pilus assembly protein CpaB